MEKEKFLNFLEKAPQNKIDALAFKCILKNELVFLFFLIQNKIVNNPKNNLGQSLLHYSIICDNVEAFNYIINNRYNVNEQDDEDRTPLHFAVASSNYYIFIKTLLDYGALINITNERNETPLFCATLVKNHKAIKLLKDLGADDTIPNDIGQLPKYIAFKNNDKLSMSLFYKNEYSD